MSSLSGKIANTSDINDSVLIIEDDPAMVDIILFGLSSAGYNGVHASDATKAFSLLASRKFGAIICDINLNTKKTGIDIYHDIERQGLHEGLFIFVTGNSIDWTKIERTENSKKPKPLIFFKPITMSRIILSLNEHCRPNRFNVQLKPEKLSPSSSDKIVPAKNTEEKPPRAAILLDIRHEIANKVMIASENAEIAILLLNKPESESAMTKNDSMVRLQRAVAALDRVANLIDDWRNLDQKAGD